MKELDYAEWLSKCILAAERSPSFHLGPIDQDRLARAVLAMAPVVKAADALRDMWSGPATIRDGVSFADEVELSRAFIDAVDTMRGALARKKGGA